MKRCKSIPYRMSEIANLNMDCNGNVMWNASNNIVFKPSMLTNISGFLYKPKTVDFEQPSMKRMKIFASKTNDDDTVSSFKLDSVYDNKSVCSVESLTENKEWLPWCFNKVATVDSELESISLQKETLSSKMFLSPSESSKRRESYTSAISCKSSHSRKVH